MGRVTPASEHGTIDELKHIQLAARLARHGLSLTIRLASGLRVRLGAGVTAKCGHFQQLL